MHRRITFTLISLSLLRGLAPWSVGREVTERVVRTASPAAPAIGESQGLPGLASWPRAGCGCSVIEHLPGDVTGDAHDGLVALAAFAKLRDRLVSEVVEAKPL